MKLKLYSILLGAVVLSSCSKFEEPLTPDFNVTLAKPTYKVGEEVLFNFSGMADMVTFFSGQEGNDYNFKDGRELSVGTDKVSLEFQSAVSGGSQANQLTVLASTDFDGNYGDLNSVKTATWTDITSGFVLGTNTTFRASNTKEITDLIIPEKPIYFAFKYITKTQEVNGIVRQWWIQSFMVKSAATFNGSAVAIANQMTAGFRIVDANKAELPARSTISSTRVTLWGHLYNDPDDPKFDPDNPIYKRGSSSYDPLAVYVPYTFNDYESENWAISRPIYIDKVDLGPDHSIAVKGMDTQPQDFSFTYSKPGTYVAYFVAKNATIEGDKEVIKSVNVTIEP